MAFEKPARSDASGLFIVCRFRSDTSTRDEYGVG
jgi:hypothetical protein